MLLLDGTGVFFFLLSFLLLHFAICAGIVSGYELSSPARGSFFVVVSKREMRLGGQLLRSDETAVQGRNETRPSRRGD